ncbi:MAG: cupin domain-containing protein [Noviherbaspirillum sp.]
MATRQRKQEMTSEHVIHSSRLDWIEHRHGAAIEAHTASVANRIGAKTLGYRLTELLPGKAAFPKHFHFANEEMFYILEGAGTLRLEKGDLPVEEGDFICIPGGDQSLAHQLVNTSSSVLRYLAVSTMCEPDVVIYPDSGQIAVFAGAAPGGLKEQRSLEYRASLNWPIAYRPNDK